MARSTAEPAADRSMPTRSAEVLLWRIAARMVSASVVAAAPLLAEATGAPLITRAALAPRAASQRVESFKRMYSFVHAGRDAAGGHGATALWQHCGPAQPVPEDPFLEPSARRYCNATPATTK